MTTPQAVGRQVGREGTGCHRHFIDTVVIPAQSLSSWRGRWELARWRKLLSREIALTKGQSRIKVKAALAKFTEKEIPKAGSEKPQGIHCNGSVCKGGLRYPHAAA